MKWNSSFHDGLIVQKHLTVFNKKCSQVSTFDTTKEVKKGGSGMLLRIYGIEYNEVSQLIISSYAVHVCSF